MEPTKEIEAIMIQSKKYVLFLCPVIFGGIGFTVLAAVSTKSLAVAWIGMIIFMAGPVIFIGRIRRFFTKKGRLQFFPDHFVVETINQDTDALEKTDELFFADIASFRSSDASKDDSSYMSFRLTDGSKFYYTFLKQFRSDPDNNVIMIVEEYVRSYNSQSDKSNTIAYMPSLLATKGGNYVFIGLTVLIVVCAIIQLIVRPSTIGYSLVPGLMIYLLLFIQRKMDIAKAKAMNEGEK
jgi:hypothetical protein